MPLALAGIVVPSANTENRGTASISKVKTRDSIRLNLLLVFLVIIVSSIINISFAPIGAIPLYHIFQLPSIDGIYEI
jgi:hypothetical protein